MGGLTMISWGSFVLGGFVFAPIFFVLGGIIGMIRNERKETPPLSSIPIDVLNHLGNGEALSFHCTVHKEGSGDDDFDFDEYFSLPDGLEDQNWRNN